MSIKDKIIVEMFNLDIFNDKNQTIIGIAKLARDVGYDSLTEKQKGVLSKIFSVRCEGFEDPGGNLNECNVNLNDGDLYEALIQYWAYGSLLCEDCRSNLDYIQHQRENFFKD